MRAIIPKTESCSRGDKTTRERSASIDTVYDSSVSLRYRAGHSYETLDMDYRDFSKSPNTGLFVVARHKLNQVEFSAFLSWCIFGDLFRKFFSLLIWTCALKGRGAVPPAHPTIRRSYFFLFPRGLFSRRQIRRRSSFSSFGGA